MSGVGDPSKGAPADGQGPSGGCVDGGVGEGIGWWDGVEVGGEVERAGGTFLIRKGGTGGVAMQGVQVGVVGGEEEEDALGDSLGQRMGRWRLRGRGGGCCGQWGGGTLAAEGPDEVVVAADLGGVARAAPQVVGVAGGEPHQASGRGTKHLWGGVSGRCRLCSPLLPLGMIPLLWEVGVRAFLRGCLLRRCAFFCRCLWVADSLGFITRSPLDGCGGSGGWGRCGW